MYRDNLANTANSTASSSELSCGDHTWHMKALDSNGNSTDSDTFYFTINCGGNFTPPAKPNVSSANITVSQSGAFTLSDLPATITQIAISATEDFKDVSWEALGNLQPILSRYADALKLYFKFRAQDGGTSDTVIYEKKGDSGSGTGSDAGNSNTALTLSDGDIVKTFDSPDVYIIKYKNNKQYRRLILSPSVFNSYRHLKWENVKTVTREQLDKYTVSHLVQVAGDRFIYELYPEGDCGQRKVIDPTQLFDIDSVYEINAADRDSYEPRG
jgi:hypothetical protein